MAARLTAWIAGLFAVVALAALPAAGSVARTRARAPSLDQARAVARQVVAEHPTNRRVVSAEPLRTRRCWRVAGPAVDCSLYRIAGTPCLLDGRTEQICVEALARRIWLVEVRADSTGSVKAKVLRVRDTLSMAGCSRDSRGQGALRCR
jgi:hypothetical protein